MRNDNIIPYMGGPTISNRLTVKLIEEMSTGKYAEAKRLPSEVDLAEELKVSRAVIRDVLANLEREGYVERGRGVGTIINREIVKLQLRLDLKFEYNDIVRATGATPSADDIEVELVRANNKLALRLNLWVGAPLVVCKKRILASGKPVVYSVDHIPEELLGKVDWKRLDWRMPVFDLLEEHGGIILDTSITRIMAVNGPADVCEKLEKPEGTALIYMEETGQYKLSRPMIHSYGYYTDYFDFTMLRKKI